MNRQEVNSRFIEVFHLLERKEYIRRNDRQRGLSKIAEHIFGDRRQGFRIRKVLNKELNIPYEAAERFCRLFGVNESYVLHGRGTPFGEPAPANRQICFLHNQAAVAGDTMGADAVMAGDRTYFSLPDLPGTGYLAFPVEGNSMEPRIYAGDVIVCKRVERWEDVKDNEIYVVVIDNRVFVKYVKKIYETDADGNRTVTKLNLISANYLEHAPFIESLTPNTRIYKVVRRLQDFN